MSLKLEILTDPVKDKEHAGAVIVVRKTLICSPEFTCTISKNKSVAGVKKSLYRLEHGNKYLHALDLRIIGWISNTNIQYNNVMSWPNFRLLTKLSFYLVKL